MRTAFLPLSALLCLAALAPSAHADPVTPSSVTSTANDLWSGVVAQQGGLQNLRGQNLFPANFSTLDPAVQQAYIGKVITELGTAAGRQRNVPAELQQHWAGLQTLLAQTSNLQSLFSTNPRAAVLLWDALQNPNASQVERLLRAYAERRGTSSLSLADFLRGVSPEQVTAILNGPVNPTGPQGGDQPGAPTGPNGGRRGPATSGSPGDVLHSVGFDGNQAYGMPGDRHVYVDSAGNIVSMSVTTRRMPDGTMEDVLHVVNLNNRAAPEGATYSLRSDFAALQQGVDVSIGGLKFKLKLTADGDDHKIEMAGDNGAFQNQKNPPEPPMSLSQLYAYRAARVFNYGRVVRFGGREYYVSPETYSQIEGQGDAAKYVGYGQFTYWPKDQLDKLFAARAGRDEADPQTFDFKSLDLSGSAFRNVRDMRPVLAATVIRREGGQDVAMPRASLGQDDKGQWWDAVLKDGQYVIQKGQPPASAPDPNTPPGQTRSDGWPQLSQYSPDTPAAQALNSALQAQNVKIYEATSPQDPGKKFLILFDKDITHAAFPPGNGGTLAIVGGKTLSVTGADGGIFFFDLARSGFQNRVPNFVASGSYSPAKPDGTGGGFQNIADADVLRSVLTLARYSPTDIGTVLQNLQTAAGQGSTFNVSGPLSGSQLPISVNVNLPNGTSVQRNIWPTLSDPTAGTGQNPTDPTGQGFRLDAISPATQVDNWGTPPSVPSVTLAPYWSSSSQQGQTPGPSATMPDRGAAGAALYSAGTGDNRPYYMVFTISRPAQGATPAQTLRRGPVLVFGNGPHTAQGASGTRDPLPTAPLHLSAVTMTADQASIRDEDLITVPSPRLADGGYIAINARGGGNRPRCVGIVAYWGTRFPTAQSAQDYENSRTP